MKKICPTIILIVLCCFGSKAQTANFKDLETPASPGFILLDQTPSAIERPTTPQGFGISMLNLLQGGAMEVAPFWLQQHPDLSAKQMFDNNFPFLYNLSFSMASANLDKGKYITFGFRSRLIQLYAGDSRKKRDSLDNEIVSELSQPTLNLSKLDALGSLYGSLVSKPVFSIDIAAALAANSDSATVSTITWARGAAWITINWRPKADNFYVTGVGRYTNNVKFSGYPDNANLMDLGGRLNYDVDKFTISAEYLQRVVLDSKISQNRFAAVASYQVNENLYFTGTFGKNFAEVKNLIAMIGVNFGISSYKVKAF
jgi:hypothetical protein